MDFFLKFTLISYASIFFFTLGLRLAVSSELDLRVIQLFLIFAAVSLPLSLTFKSQPLYSRFLMSLTCTSLILTGFRFGRKIKRLGEENPLKRHF
jgi:hypothetical protein